MKSYILEVSNGLNTKLQFPKDDKQDLGLVQHFLITQCFIPIGINFMLDLIFTDTQKVKRRIHFSTAISKSDKTYFQINIPIPTIKRNSWINLQVNILSYIEQFGGITFRSLDQIIIQNSCKIRKIFTIRQSIEDNGIQINLPKTIQFPLELPYENILLENQQQYQNDKQSITESKNHLHVNNISFANINSSQKHEQQTPINQKLKSNNNQRRVPIPNKNNVLKNQSQKQQINQKQSGKSPMNRFQGSQNKRQSQVSLEQQKKHDSENEVSKNNIKNPWLNKNNKSNNQKKQEEKKQEEFLIKTQKFNTMELKELELNQYLNDNANKDLHYMEEEIEEVINTDSVSNNHRNNEENQVNRNDFLPTPIQNQKQRPPAQQGIFKPFNEFIINNSNNQIDEYYLQEPLSHKLNIETEVLNDIRQIQLNGITETKLQSNPLTVSKGNQQFNTNINNIFSRDNKGYNVKLNRTSNILNRSNNTNNTYLNNKSINTHNNDNQNSVLDDSLEQNNVERDLSKVSQNCTTLQYKHKKKQKEGYVQSQIKQIYQQQLRPNSPPFLLQNHRTLDDEQPQEMYYNDQLNCFYDPTTHTQYPKQQQQSKYKQEQQEQQEESQIQLELQQSQ